MVNVGWQSFWHNQRTHPDGATGGKNDVPVAESRTGTLLINPVGDSVSFLPLRKPIGSAFRCQHGDGRSLIDHMVAVWAIGHGSEVTKQTFRQASQSGILGKKAFPEKLCLKPPLVI